MTAQEADEILWEGEQRMLLSNPLEAYFEQHERPPLSSPHTANWRGYVASWAVEDGQLYLVGFRGWTHEQGAQWEEVGWDFLFPEGPQRVAASWFTGTLRIPDGELVRYVHMGYGSTYERNILVTVEAGRVVGVEVVDGDVFPGAVGRATLVAVPVCIVFVALQVALAWYFLSEVLGW